MISVQEELQKAREADIARGLVEAEALHGMLAENKTLGEKHEELSQLQAEQEKGTLKDKDDPKKPAGEDGHFLAEKREEIKRSLLVNHKIPDVIKKAGEMWKSIPTDLRQRFEGNLQDRTGGIQEVDEDLQCTEGGLANGSGGDNTSGTDSPEAYKWLPEHQSD